MRLLITGGGTGGHIYPALAMARYVKNARPGASILFVGAEGGMEEKIVPDAGFPLETLPVKGFSRKQITGAFHTVYLLGNACVRAKRIIERFKPEAVFGTGGYASAPTIIAALAERRKVIIHEQNIVPGMTNRFLAPWVDRVCLSFEASKPYYWKKRNTVVTGNPRASEMNQLQKGTARNLLNMNKNIPLLLVSGGSRGAARINQCMVEFLENTRACSNIQVLYITGEVYYDEIVSRLERNRVFDQFGKNLQVRAYQQEMSVAMAAADLMISRAGATTLAEITSLGVPTILIPSPNVVNDHQLKNARSLADVNAAILLEEKELTAQTLKDQIDELVNQPLKRESLSLNSRKLGKPKAAEMIYDLIAF